MYNNKNEVQMLDFSKYGDERGYLVTIEGTIDVPFEIKRVFYIYGTETCSIRGKHANKESAFVLINLSGSCDVKVIDQSGSVTVYRLNRPQTGLFLPKMVWKEMYNFSKDSVLLVLASTHYDADEYIRSFDSFSKNFITR